jgi:PTH1 family peptidyl-tRNA hydrolase
LDKIASIHCFTFSQKKFKAETATGRIGGAEVILAKPQTFMNMSGEAVGQILRYYKRQLSELLVVYDDVDLPFGSLRLRAQGGSGGHKGMKSIVAHLGGEEFPRLRIGIGGERLPADLSEYVLHTFTADERVELDAIIRRACDAVEAAVTGPLDSAMNMFN